MRLKIIFILIMITFFITSAESFGDIAVVVNADNKVKSLSRQQVIDLFMGRHVAFPDGSFALPFDLPVDDKTRKEFYHLLTGKTVPQINAYWARLIFSGRATPPRMVKSTEELVEAMKNNKNSIAYIDTARLGKNMKVVWKIKTDVDNGSD